MIDVVVATSGAALAAMWLLAFLIAPVAAKGRQAECEALGLTAGDYISAVRIRVTLNILSILCAGYAGWALAPLVGLEQAIGGALGLLAAMPIAYLVFALANKFVWPGFNDKFVAVRNRARQRRRSAAT